MDKTFVSDQTAIPLYRRSAKVFNHAFDRSTFLRRRYAQTGKAPPKAAIVPETRHDVDATNYVTTTKIPPSCSHEPRESRPHLRPAHTRHDYGIPFYVRIPIPLIVRKCRTRQC